MNVINKWETYIIHMCPELILVAINGIVVFVLLFILMIKCVLLMECMSQ